MNQILTDDDLERLTGFARKHKQRQMLHELGIKFFKRADGRPAVPLCSVQAALGLSVATSNGHNATDSDDDGFNLGAPL